MALFGKKAPEAAPAAAGSSSASKHAHSLPAQAAHVSSASVDNPRTVILSFLHEASKTSGMREFVKNYFFHSLNEDRFLVVVELKDAALGANAPILVARWQLLQLGVMRYAQSKGVKLAGISCTLPLDKATPLHELKHRAQLDAPVPQAFAGQSQFAPSSLQIGASRFPPSAAPESQIEVSHESEDAAEEFFRLTQPPPNAEKA